MVIEVAGVSPRFPTTWGPHQGCSTGVVFLRPNPPVYVSPTKVRPDFMGDRDSWDVCQFDSSQISV